MRSLSQSPGSLSLKFCKDLPVIAAKLSATCPCGTCLSRPDLERTARLRRFFGGAREKGISLSTIDALIAAIALEHGAGVFTVDKDFVRIARITNLPLHPLP